MSVEKESNGINETDNAKNRKSEKAPSQWKLMWHQFKKHKLAMVGLSILIVFYLMALAPNFFAPYSPRARFTKEGHINFPPQQLRFIDEDGKFHFRPFIYDRQEKFNLDTYEKEITIDKSKKYYLHFFVRGDEYKLFSLFPSNLHLFGFMRNGRPFPGHLFGTNSLAQDLFSRNIHAMQISLSIGFLGVFISMILGVLIGGASGYYGGTVDLISQRGIEILMGIPRIPLWMALAAAIPQRMSAIKIYFLITVILSLIGWTGLARNIRSKLISLKNEDFVRAARNIGASDLRIILFHMVPNFFSYVIVHLTLAIPGMIIGETALSFLGIGLKPPVVSWGVLLQQAQTFRNVTEYPWIMIPGAFVVIAVLSFNFVGDGLRDAADPFSVMR